MPTGTLVNVPIPLDGQSGAYRRFQAGTNYDNDSGQLVCPVAGPPGTPPRVIQVYAPIEFQTVKFDACKEGTPPIVPQIGVNRQNGAVFLEGTLSLRPFMADGQNCYNFVSKGEYLFVKPGPPTGYNSTDVFTTFTLPFDLPLIDIAILGNQQTSTLISNNQTASNQIESSSWQWPYTNFVQSFFSNKLI